MARCYNKIYLKRQNIWVNCGKCLNCIAEKNKEYTVRMIDEIESNKELKYKYFITLTYDDLHYTGELCKKDLTDYIERIQRVARQISKKNTFIKNVLGGIRLKYFATGEYGAKTLRGHYHVVIASNSCLQRTIKQTWKKGHAEIQEMDSIKAIAYTCGYEQKKIGFNDKRLGDKQAPFRKFSRGIGREKIYELIAKQKISPERYYRETNFYNKVRLPQYYKNILKQEIMGVKEQRKVIKNEADRLEAKRLGYEKEAKTYVKNINEYEANLWKWENFIRIPKEREKQRLEYLYNDKNTYRRYCNNAELLYNLMYNQDYEPEDYRDYQFRRLHEAINEKLKIEARDKYYRTVSNRIAV